MVDAHGEELAEVIEETGCSFSHWGDASLKDVPAPYDAAHPQPELLKRRSLVLDAPLGEGWREDGGLLTALIGRCEAMLPVWRLLDERMRRTASRRASVDTPAV